MTKPPIIKSVRPLKPARRGPPWWWPDQRGGALIGLFSLTAGILWYTRPIGGAEPSEFFKAIAQAVVLTGFLAAISFLFNAAKGTSEANARTDAVLDATAQGRRTQLPDEPEGG